MSIILTHRGKRFQGRALGGRGKMPGGDCSTDPPRVHHPPGSRRGWQTGWLEGRRQHTLQATSGEFCYLLFFIIIYEGPFDTEVLREYVIVLSESHSVLLLNVLER